MDVDNGGGWSKLLYTPLSGALAQVAARLLSCPGEPVRASFVPLLSASSCRLQRCETGRPFRRYNGSAALCFNQIPTFLSSSHSDSGLSTENTCVGEQFPLVGLCSYLEVEGRGWLTGRGVWDTCRSLRLFREHTSVVHSMQACSPPAASNDTGLKWTQIFSGILVSVREGKMGHPDFPCCKASKDMMKSRGKGYGSRSCDRSCISVWK